ncbi:unnamed protein product [Vicia faba]|uniref:Uncharacterized protein n=1 Tax=Vicia faba TaxID=3906 RepID=A0AAV1AM04_VICFA|nr:unnamed protein product [Vicia faba]
MELSSEAWSALKIYHQYMFEPTSSRHTAYILSSAVSHNVLSGINFDNKSGHMKSTRSLCDYDFNLKENITKFLRESYPFGTSTSLLDDWLALNDDRLMPGNARLIVAAFLRTSC